MIAGLPGSHVERMCASLVAVNRERVRWVVVKCKCIDDDSFQLNKEHLQVNLHYCYLNVVLFYASAEAEILLLFIIVLL